MSAAGPYIYHLVPETEFLAVPEGQAYRPVSLGVEGFIHCTQEPTLLLEVANRLYQSVPGHFQVLVIDPAQLTAPLRFEPPAPPPAPTSPLAGKLFPHIYGPLNPEAVVSMRRAVRAPDGRFLAV